MKNSTVVSFQRQARAAFEFLLGIDDLLPGTDELVLSADCHPHREEKKGCYCDQL